MNHTLLRSAAQQRAVLTLALFLCASILAHAATWYVRTTGSDANDGTSTAQAFLTIQKAINSAANGDVIDVGAGTFAPTTTLAVNKEVRITGQGEGTTIIDVGGYNAWGIYITANNVTIEDLTVDGDATTNLQFCVKIGTGGPAGAGKSVAEDFTLEDVTIQNTWRTALDLNGVDGAAITRVTCQNVGNGFGMSISSSHNVTVTNLTTSNCAWGDAGIFPANTAFQWNTALDGPDNIVFAGMLTLGAGSISVQDGALSDSRGTWVGTISNDPADNANVTVPTSFTHYVNATRSGGLVLHNVGTEANIVTLAQGMAVGIAPFTFSNITVRDMANDEWDVPSGLKIQAAIDAATAGDVVNVAAGTFAETIIIAKPLTLKGANYGVAGNAGRGGESIISGASTGGALGAVMVNGNGSSSMPVTIDGFWILKGTTPNIRGILLGNTTSVKGPITISNNIINGGWSTGISLAGGATVGWVDDVTITNNKLVGSGIGSTENATDLVIQNNTFDNAGLGLGGGASMAAAISGNTFTGTTTSRYVGIANGVTLATGETLASIVANNTFDKSVALSAASGQWYTQAIFAQINPAVSVAATGATLTVSAGTYNEAITINKSLTLTGAVDGSGEPTTALALATGQSGITVSASDVTVNNVGVGQASVGTRYAYGITFGSSVTNLTLNNVAVDGASVGLRVGSGTGVDGLTVTNSHFDNCVQGWYLTAETAASTNGTRVENVSVSNTTFSGNTQKGIYAEKLNDAVFDGITIANSGTDATYGFNNGIDINLKWQSYSNITIRNSSITGSGVYGTAPNALFPAAVAIKARDDSPSYNGTGKPPASLSNVLIENTVISGPEHALRFGEPGKNSSSPTNATVTNCSLIGENTAGTTGDGIVNTSTATISATCNWYGSTDIATVASKISGNVDATPFLVDGTDSSTDPGFQPAAGACTGTGPVLVYSDVAESTLVDTYFTIQSAIDATTTLDGYVVRVPAGTYREFVTINKQLDLRGPNWNTPGNSTSRWAEAIIRFPAGETATSMSLVDIGIWNSTSNPANGSKIRGFTIDGSDYTVGYNTSGVYAVQSDLIIENNIIRNFNQQSIVVTSWRYIGGNWSNTYWTNGADISDNLIVNDGVLLPSLNNASYGFGIYMQGSYGTVERNAVQGYFRTGIQIQPYNHPNTSNLVGLVSSNSFAGYARGMYFNYSENANGDWLFEHNDVTGIAVPTGLSNTFSAVHVNTFLAGNCSIENNSIALGDASGTTNLLFLEQNTTNGTFTATCNWWGSDDAATVASNISGNVSFLPFLSSVAPSDYTNPGFTPSGDCDGLGPVTSDDPVASYMTIQSAINGANTGATITASAGTYTENVNLNKEVTLTGTGATIAGTTTISDEDAVLTNMTLNGSPALTFSSGIGSYTLGASNTFDAACTTYVQLTNASTNVTLPGTTVLGGTTLSTLTPNAAENYAIEDKINHGVDDSYAGIVRWNGNRLYVTANTGTLQHVIDVASTSDAIYIDNITVNENPILYKDIVLNSRSSAARRLGTSNYFVFGTTSLGTSNFSGFTTGELDKIGVNTNGSVSEAITAVNASGTVLLTDAVQSGGTADTEFSTTITIDDKALTVMGVGTTGTDECAVAPKMSINAGNSSLISLDGTQDVVLENLDLIIGSTGTFAEIANGATGDITGKDLRFYVDNGTTTTRLMGIQSKTFPTILADNKDVPEYILDGNDVGYGPGEFIFANSAPIDRSKLIAAWKGNDASGTSIATLYDYSGSGYDLTQTTGSRRPQKSTAVFGESVYIPNSGTRLLTRNSNADISTGTAKTIFVVFRTPSGGSGNRIIYKHGDDAAGFSLGLLGNGNVEMNLFSGGELATFTQAIATNTNVIAQAYFDGSSTTNRVGMSYDYGTTHVNDVFTSGDFNTASLAAPPYNATSQVTLGGLEGETYFNGGSRNSRRPGFIAKNTYIAEVIILNTADDGVRDDVYCYLNQKYGAGDSENGLPKWMNEPEPIDEDIIAGEVHNVWPNPATDLATVSFTVPEAQTVTITLVDALGRPAATVASEYMSAGDQAYEFSVENIPSGLYTVAINGFTFNASVPVMVRK